MKYFTRVRPPESSPETPGRAIAETLALIAEPLREVDESIRAQAEAFDPAVAPYAAYALASSGKRLRPAMALLAGGATGGLTPEHTHLAVIVEMIHLATLVHDDIMDGADTRRDQPTPNARWGNAITVLLGDCLFAHALDLASQFDEAQISRKIARAANAVCTGEIIQTQRRFDLNLSHEDYFSIIEKKTAALFAVAAELGAVLNHAEPAAVAAMQSFGLRLGTAYQVYDDCLDLAGDEADRGQDAGHRPAQGQADAPDLEPAQGRLAGRFGGIFPDDPAGRGTGSRGAHRRRAPERRPGRGRAHRRGTRARCAGRVVDPAGNAAPRGAPGARPAYCRADRALRDGREVSRVEHL